MSFLLLFALCAFAKPLVDRIATHRSVVGFLQQKAGYQYYTRVALPELLESQLGAAYATATASPSVLSGTLFDDARKQAHAYCAMLHNRMQADVPDKCTSISFSPFAMSCELKLVVTVECAARRNAKDAERYNALMTELLALRVYEDARAWLLAYDDSKRKSERMRILFNAST
jgi:hypothetical protein